MNAGRRREPPAIGYRERTRMVPASAKSGPGGCMLRGFRVCAGANGRTLLRSRCMLQGGFVRNVA